jgi:2-dehydropantoate 2-reductase
MLTAPILIAGAGALGSVMGGMLRAAGHRVALLGRPRHLEAIARHGLVLDGLFGRREVNGFELFHDEDELRGRRFGAIVVAVKSYDTAQIVPRLAGLLDEGGVAISAQNGLGNLEILADHFGAQQVLAARVIFGAEMAAAGNVRVTVFAEPVMIGPAPNLSGADRNGAQRRGYPGRSGGRHPAVAVDQAVLQRRAQSARRVAQGSLRCIGGGSRAAAYHGPYR